MNTKINLPFS